MEILNTHLCQIELVGLIIFLIGAICWVSKNTSLFQTEYIVFRQFTRWDIFSISIIILYGVLSYYNLGSRNSSGVWYGDTFNKSITMNFASPTNINELDLFACIQSGSYKINYETINGEKGTIAVVDGLKDRLPLSCQWQKIPVTNKNILYKKLSIVVERPLSKFIKILVFGQNHQPITAYSVNGDIDSNLENIRGVFYGKNFDIPNFEQTATFYDEDSYAIMAYRYLTGTKIYNLSHPQLGILSMIPGIKIFGMTPLGWRFMSFVAGVLILIVTGLFARTLFNSSKMTALTILLFSIEFIHFTLSRIAIIESFVTLFIMSGYYFLLLYTQNRKYNPLVSYRYLYLSVIFSALALASKSTGAFMIPAVLIVFLVMEVNASKIFPLAPKFVVKFILLSIASYVIVYILSYTPFLLKTQAPELFQIFYNTQKLLWLTQTKLATASSSSSFIAGSGFGAAQAWWQWPLVIPYSVYFWIAENHQSVNVVFMGNPLEWWMGFPVFLISVCNWVILREFKIGFLLLLFICQYFSYAFISRESYSYYFYSAVPILILMIVYTIYLGWQMNKLWLKGVIVLYVIMCIIVFILFYPVISGYPVSRMYVFHYLLWFKSWHI